MWTRETEVCNTRAGVIVVDGEWYPQPQITHEPMAPPEKRVTCPACGLHHGSVGATINCMANAIFTLRAQQSSLSENEEKLAERAYCAYSQALFGRATGPVTPDLRTGFPRGQSYGAPWDKLPEHIKNQWRAVVSALRS